MDVKRVTAPEAKQLIDEQGYTVLDVRSTPEYVSEHSAGAYNVPYLHKQPYGMVANPDFARVVQAIFPDRSTKILTTCGMGGRSIRAAAELQNLGYQNIIDLRGGFEGEKDEAGNITVPGWKAAKLPVESGEPAGRAYAQLYSKVAPSTPPPAPKEHSHGHEAPKTGGGSRFADPRRTIQCIKLGRALPGLKRRPMGGELGQKIYDQVSAEAWEQWVEHSKLLINEYRLNPSEAKAQEMLLKQCEEFLFGGGEVKVPDEFVPKN